MYVCTVQCVQHSTSSNTSVRWVVGCGMSGGQLLWVIWILGSGAVCATQSGAHKEREPEDATPRRKLNFPFRDCILSNTGRSKLIQADRGGGGLDPQVCPATRPAGGEPEQQKRGVYRTYSSRVGWKSD